MFPHYQPASRLKKDNIKAEKNLGQSLSESFCLMPGRYNLLMLASGGPQFINYNYFPIVIFLCLSRSVHLENKSS